MGVRANAREPAELGVLATDRPSVFGVTRVVCRGVIPACEAVGVTRRWDEKESSKSTISSSGGTLNLVLLLSTGDCMLGDTTESIALPCPRVDAGGGDKTGGTMARFALESPEGDDRLGDSAPRAPPVLPSCPDFSLP
jgi:hypothetical protein